MPATRYYTYNMVIGRESSQVITVERWAAGFVSVGTLHQEQKEEQHNKETIKC